MLRTTSPNISIITNFGCRTNCWYCIWKNHPLKDVYLKTDWIKLTDFLTQYKDKGKVSVSGGGDCLYRYDLYESWWDRLFSVCKEFGFKIDVHSREKFYNEAFWKNINKCVISSDNLIDDRNYFLWLLRHTQIRIVHVATTETTDKMIESYIDFQKQNSCQFTIKQLTGYDDNGAYERLKKKYPGVYYLDEGDYNIYYMPNNTISSDFLTAKPMEEIL